MMGRVIRAVFFDLDNTLYDGRQYLSSAFEDISNFLAQRISVDKEAVNLILNDEFEKRGSLYPYLFDEVLKRLNLYDKEPVTEIVELYRRSCPRLELYRGTREILLKLKEEYILGMITNGDAGMQKRKLDILDISHLFEKVVYAKSYDKARQKLSGIPYRVALEELDLKPWQSIYIGDNPHTDFVEPKKIGVKTVRLLKGEFAAVTLSEEYEADYRIKQLSKIFDVLKLIELQSKEVEIFSKREG